MFDPFTTPGFLIRRLQQISVRIFQDATAAFGISTVQYGALQVIEHQPGIDQASLSQATDTDRTTIVRVVERLNDFGLISKESSPEDRRANRLHITAAGVRLLRAIYEHAEASQRTLLSPLAQTERSDFLRYLRVLVMAHSEYSLSATPHIMQRENASYAAAHTRRPQRQPRTSAPDSGLQPPATK